jgi:pyrroline-5-carboxylate reductase
VFLLTKIGFIGAGNMAGAIIECLCKKNVVNPSNLWIFDIDEAKCKTFSERGINTAPNISNISNLCDVVFLCVKPQNFEEVLNQIKDHMKSNLIIVSIAAGISVQYIKNIIGKDSKVIRTMPNTPLMLGIGAIAMSHCAPVTLDEFNMVKGYFDATGIVEVVPEDKMNAVISVNGSSPAYVYLFAKAIIEGAGKQGIDAELAKKLFAQTLIGSAKMITDSGKSPDELIKMVSSPGGTTLKALETFYNNHFEQIIIDAMLNCTKRAEELGR